ncbi:Oxygen-independent coproporphyrinogen-III oxidase [Phaeobacter sp. CECT 5382]|uniref:oxygen-independent coproporphyrinogen III oxidase n=1 Tax=Phaeobacter sp. CECT 5382 TaxID=1712645 RepID=UPI0006DA3519|nr:oxygen-independent coproporphyrinogen III oxidase [Phaeobacter sp. CECT 5382]CUH88126.1 Oxygen-independent coproporphyrinogen-III oxidase [Phaeobacter sp. CECT 5382]
MCPKPQLAKLGLFDAKVPRYTSYPTAPHFGAEIDSGDFASWLGDIQPESQISLYLHIPFCRRLCWFCACRTQGTRSDGDLSAYLDVLKQEISLLKSHLPPDVSLSRVHFGGGTPTILPPEMIRDLTGAIADLAPLAPGGEFSVEIDPNEFDQQRCDAFLQAGMNRASIGVQDFDGTIQQAIGRIQSYQLTHETVEMLRTGGVRNLSADILFGLPHQTKARITKSIEQLLSLAPDRIALYGYAHVPWMARRQTMIPTETLPTPEDRLELFDTAKALLMWDGFEEIGIDHFARPQDGLAQARNSGQLRRNFQGYTDDPAEVLIGLGASAISRLPQGYAQNAPSTAAYMSEIRQGHLATARGHAFQGDDQLRARLIEMLMCEFRISLTEITRQFPHAASQLPGLFAKAQQAFPGMVEVTQEGLSITHAARPLTRMIARSFDAYGLASSGHSSAI